MKYPRYSKKLNLACKLSEKDIRKIQKLRRQGKLYREISNQFSITPSGARYWCVSEEERKKRNKKHYLRTDRFRNKAKKRDRQKKSINRKYATMLEYREYRRKYRKNKRHLYRESLKK